MPRAWAVAALVGLVAPPAWADSLSVIANESVTFVSGPTSGPATVPTQTGSVEIGGFHNPVFRAGISAQMLLPLTPHSTLVASYGVFRNQPLCDTCRDGEGPGWVGEQVIGTTDLTVSFLHSIAIGKAFFRVTGIAVLPASREAWSCNPMFGAPGASVAWIQPVGNTTIAASARVLRPIYQFSAAPVGRCAPALRGTRTVRTLTGAADPLPWNSSRWTGANPDFTGSLGFTWIDPHGLWKEAPKLLTSSLFLGLNAHHNAPIGATKVPTLTGEQAIAGAFRPWNAVVPWSLSVGIRPRPGLNIALNLSNQVPTWLADPGGTFRALPAQTAVSILARQRIGPSTPLTRRNQR